jgi:hypothetical protein
MASCFVSLRGVVRGLLFAKDASPLKACGVAMPNGCPSLSGYLSRLVARKGNFELG